MYFYAHDCNVSTIEDFDKKSNIGEKILIKQGLINEQRGFFKTIQSVCRAGKKCQNVKRACLFIKQVRVIK